VQRLGRKTSLFQVHCHCTVIKITKYSHNSLFITHNNSGIDVMLVTVMNRVHDVLVVVTVMAFVGE